MSAAPTKIDHSTSGFKPSAPSWPGNETMLALAVGCAVAIRLTVSTIGVGAALVGAAGLGLAVAAYVGVTLRYQATRNALRNDATLRGVSAWPLIAASATMVALGSLAALFVFGAF